jgi:hypothetical protein
VSLGGGGNAQSCKEKRLSGPAHLLVASFFFLSPYLLPDVFGWGRSVSLLGVVEEGTLPTWRALDLSPSPVLQGCLVMLASSHSIWERDKSPKLLCLVRLACSHSSHGSEVCRRHPHCCSSSAGVPKQLALLCPSFEVLFWLPLKSFPRFIIALSEQKQRNKTIISLSGSKSP